MFVLFYKRLFPKVAGHSEPGGVRADGPELRNWDTEKYRTSTENEEKLNNKYT